MNKSATSVSTPREGSAGLMKAYRIHKFGPPEVIVEDTIARPRPSAGEVCVRVLAAGVGPWDGWIRAGTAEISQPLPFTLGSDFSGVVEAIGEEVTGVVIGDAVFGATNPDFIGSYAEYAIANANMIARKPSTIDDVAAASVPIVAVTAWQALFDEAELKAGQTVVIHGAAGNVGAYAVQFARKAGLQIIATASLDDAQRVLRLGAHQVVDPRTDRFEDKLSDIDAVIDLVGGDLQNRSFHVLRRGGKLISAVSEPAPELAEKFAVHASFFLVKVTTERLQEIAKMIDIGGLEINVGLTLPLSDAVKAHEMLEGTIKRPKGKIVLKVSA